MTEAFTFMVNSVEFLVVEFKATETISQPFCVDLSLASEEDVEADGMMNQEGLLSITGTDDRHFHGIINEFRQAECRGRFFLYRARLVPALWLLSLRRDCRIFQNMSVPDIVQEVLSGVNILQNRVISRLRNTYPPREYCVQYRETDLDFISRLLEDEGIFYFFGHSQGQHVLILGDDSEICRPISGEHQINYRTDSGLAADEESIQAFDSVRQLHPNNITLNDYNFRQPSVDLTCNQNEEDGCSICVFEYPGNYCDTDTGRNVARVRFQEATVLRLFAEGRSNCHRLTAGHKFQLQEHDRSVLDGEYILVEVRHSGKQPQVIAERSTEGGFEYSNELIAIPASVTFRPPRRTPKARIQGLQSAIVVGPENEEIYTDEYGRVKVRFFWDHATGANGANDRDENRSCWIRVVQSAAGPGWGTLFLPRVGNEVIVDFLEGDPDRPIITGQVYHATHRPPYTLPDEKTRSVVRTSSTPDGGGFNEIRFEDRKDSEQLFIHAQKDYELRVLNDRVGWIGNENHLTVALDKLEKVDGDKHLTVTGDHNEKVGGTLSIESGMDLQSKAGGKHGLEATTEIHIKGGMKVVIEAATQVSLKAGGSFVDIGPAGVSLQGAMININSGGSAGSGSGISTETPRLPREPDEAQSEDAMPPAQTSPSPQAAAFRQAAVAGRPFCEI